MRTVRPDRQGSHQLIYRRNRKRIIAQQSVCAICGRPVDKELKSPHPMAPSVDHIIPVSKGGHPSDINNLQLAHWICNRMKSNKLFEPDNIYAKKNSIKLSCDWKSF